MHRVKDEDVQAGVRFLKNKDKRSKKKRKREREKYRVVTNSYTCTKYRCKIS